MQRVWMDGYYTIRQYIKKHEHFILSSMIRKKIRLRLARLYKEGIIAARDKDIGKVKEISVRIAEVETILKLLK